MTFSPDGKLLASGDGDGTVRLWDPVTGRAVRTIQAQTSQGPGVGGVAFSPDGELLASANGDGTVGLWDPATGRPVRTIQADPVGPITAVAFSRVGELLASVGFEGTVRLRDPATGHSISTMQVRAASQNAGVPVVAFSPDSKLLASADNDGTVRCGKYRYSLILMKRSAPTSAHRHGRTGSSTLPVSGNPMPAPKPCRC